MFILYIKENRISLQSTPAVPADAFCLLNIYVIYLESGETFPTRHACDILSLLSRNAGNGCLFFERLLKLSALNAVLISALSPISSVSKNISVHCIIIFFRDERGTVCPRSSDLFYIVSY